MVSIMLYPSMFCVACLTVCELFGETIHNMCGCVCYLLLNGMELLSVVGGALLDRQCMVFHRMGVLCLWSQ